MRHYKPQKAARYLHLHYGQIHINKIKKKWKT